MTAVDILLYIAKHQGEFPNLKGRSPVQVLALLPDPLKDDRYRRGEEGLTQMLKQIPYRNRTGIRRDTPGPGGTQRHKPPPY